MEANLLFTNFIKKNLNKSFFLKCRALTMKWPPFFLSYLLGMHTSELEHCTPIMHGANLQLKKPWCTAPECFTAAPTVFSTWPCKWRFGEEMSKHVGLAQQNGFFAQNICTGCWLRLVNRTAKPNICCCCCWLARWY